MKIDEHFFRFNGKLYLVFQFQACTEISVNSPLTRAFVIREIIVRTAPISLFVFVKLLQESVKMAPLPGTRQPLESSFEYYADFAVIAFHGPIIFYYFHEPNKLKTLFASHVCNLD